MFLTAFSIAVVFLVFFAFVVFTFGEVVTYPAEGENRGRSRRRDRYLPAPGI